MVAPRVLVTITMPPPHHHLCPFPIVRAGECPNSCSGNGVCKLLSAMTDTLAVPYSNSAWDANRIQTCVCDNGFFGADCSQREYQYTCMVAMNTRWASPS